MEKNLKLTVEEKALLESMVALDSITYGVNKGYQCDPCDACGPDACFSDDGCIYD